MRPLLHSAFYRALFEHSAEPMLIYLPDGSILEANQAAYEKSEHSKSDLLAMKIWQLSADDSETLFKERMELLETQGDLTFEATHIASCGEKQVVEVHISLISIDDTKLVLSIARDIESRKKKERTLEQEREAAEHVATIQAKTLQVTNEQLRNEIADRRRIQKSLEENRDHFRSLFELAPDAIFLQTISGEVINCNLAATRITGFTRQELATMTVWDLLLPEERDHCRAFMEKQAVKPAAVQPDEFPFFLPEAASGTGASDRGARNGLKEGQPESLEATILNRAGISIPIEILTRTISLNTTDTLNVSGNRQALLVVFRDISTRRKAEHQLKLFERVFQNALEGITITDRHGTIIAVNDAFSVITGYSEAEALGKNPRILKSDRHHPAFYEAMWQSIITEGKWEGEIWNRRKDGEAYPERLSISAIKDAHERVTNYVAVFHDITELKKKELQIKHQAFHDSLTGLPNRLLFKDRLAQAIARAGRANSTIAVLFIDLDNFKNINDSLGHAVGDKFLQEVAAALKSQLRSEDTVARQGGDEFIIILESIPKQSDVMHFADRLNEYFRSPVQVEEHELYATMSIGISFYPDDGNTPERLIKNADLAMYRAKEKGKDSYRMFTTALNEEVTRRLEVEKRIRQALINEEFTVYYQPKIDILSARVTGMEALARWITPDGSFVSPAEFIPIAEEAGFIYSIGERILLRACWDTKTLIDAGHSDLRCAVNISAQEFQSPHIVDIVKQVLKITKLPAKHLELEITETTLITDVDKTTQTLQEFSRLGISLAIDDFGSGYSSLQYLKHFPIDVLKIDQEFIRDIPQDSSGAAIVSTIIAMAEHMKKQVIAEGVEVREQLNFLLLQGCDEVQGYLFGKPMPFDEFRNFLTCPVRLDFDSQEE